MQSHLDIENGLRLAIKEANAKSLSELKLQMGDDALFANTIKKLLPEIAIQWEKDHSLNEIAKRLEIIHHISPISLTMISHSLFPGLLFEYPKLMHEFIKTNPNEVAEFKNQLSKNLLFSYDIYPFLGVATNNIDDFVKCIKLLKTDIFYEEMHKILVQTCIQRDASALVLALEDKFTDENLKMIFEFDSIRTFAEMLPKDNFSLSDPNYLLQYAFNKRAHKCLNELLKQKPNLKKEAMKFIEKSIQVGDGLVILALCENNFPLLAQYLDNHFKTNKVEDLFIKMEDFFIKLMRFTPLNVVDKIYSEYLKTTKYSLTIVISAFNKAKDIFVRAAPFFARISKPESLENLNKCYLNTNDVASQAQGDIDFGNARRAYAEKLCNELSTANQVLKPNSPFDTLAKGENGLCRAAYLLEKIAESNSKSGKNDATRSAFNTLRNPILNASQTPVGGRYQWASPIISQIYFQYHLADIVQDMSYHKSKMSFYQLKYKEDHVGTIGIMKDSAMWFHGRANLNKTWSAIENIFNDLWEMKIDPHHLDQTQLREFYAKMATLVWLIGNTQPLLRGTGTYAEVIMGMLHLHHGLNPPVLKLDFPQLDVLDITFPKVEEYIEFFPHFFEPSTLALNLPKDYDFNKSTFEQIEDLYRKRNLNKEVNVNNNNAIKSDAIEPPFVKLGIFSHPDQPAAPPACKIYGKATVLVKVDDALILSDEFISNLKSAGIDEIHLLTSLKSTNAELITKKLASEGFKVAKRDENDNLVAKPQNANEQLPVLVLTSSHSSSASFIEAINSFNIKLMMLKEIDDEIAKLSVGIFKSSPEKKIDVMKSLRELILTTSQNNAYPDLIIKWLNSSVKTDVAIPVENKETVAQLLAEQRNVFLPKERLVKTRSEIFIQNLMIKYTDQNLKVLNEKFRAANENQVAFKK